MSITLTMHYLVSIVYLSGHVIVNKLTRNWQGVHKWFYLEMIINFALQTIDTMKERIADKTKILLW